MQFKSKLAIPQLGQCCMRYFHDKAMTDLNFVQVLYQNWQINQKVQRLRTSRNCIITDKLSIETSKLRLRQPKVSNMNIISGDYDLLRSRSNCLQLQ